ncbi:MAG: hypothetical protein JWM89_2323 [Acidimicrobiales bacterium]|nr:hypothetical protein [Acidimicrobiales bacterium]
MILDAGFLVSVDRGDAAARAALIVLSRDRATLRTTHPVVAQVWRAGATQARLAAFLRTVEIHPFDDGRAVGRLLAAVGTRDVVDAHLVVLAARLDPEILTGDPRDLQRLAAATGDGVAVWSWPERARQ